MKSIKFRAWLKDEKKMIDVKAIDFDEDGDVCSVNYPEGKSYCGYDRNNIVLMQYTGMKDKNNMKIFDGDIVKLDETEICFIEWDEYYCVYKVKDKESDDFLTDFEPNDLEVIGNIWEHPELLEVKDVD